MKSSLPATESRAATENENFVPCPRCGTPVFVDPTTGQTEACSNCKSLKSPRPLQLGCLLTILLIAFGFVCLYILKGVMLVDVFKEFIFGQ